MYVFMVDASSLRFNNSITAVSKVNFGKVPERSKYGTLLVFSFFFDIFPTNLAEHLLSYPSLLIKTRFASLRNNKRSNIQTINLSVQKDEKHVKMLLKIILKLVAISSLILNFKVAEGAKTKNQFAFYLFENVEECKKALIFEKPLVEKLKLLREQLVQQREKIIQATSNLGKANSNSNPIDRFSTLHQNYLNIIR